MDVKNSILNSGHIGGNATNIVLGGTDISDKQWQELSMFAAKNGTDEEYHQVREVETLIKQGKTKEAGNVWSGIRWFFDTAVARGANVAQIAEFVHDILKKSGAVS